ncbi:tRNA-processing RNAse BN [Humidesulfovibrio mexicanus]|uniref:tRNA-processing RNAse BN n=1 Tax=Humidesulfovibrio mexicanus TaxID=147047 RepID=A0A239D7C1_9BACT|nr:YihY/virulence factor BrkB family protein [Humidesulfovibrio mexicanus]SNS27473.1 tRNA-processing RNAse BN [Humidesulfovibrio mexicanus]
MGQSWGKGLGARLERHFSRDIWAKDAGDVGGLKGKAYALSRLGHMVVKGFLADHCIIRASALTFTTILSIVPLLAVAFSISKGFGLQNAGFFRNFLMGIAADRVEVVNKILQYIANTNVKTLGWIGVGTLLLTVFTTVGNVERAFNSIWNVKRGRSSWRKFTDFFSVIVICPIIVLVAASLTVAVQKLDLVQDFLSASGSVGLEEFLLKLFSLSLVWVGFIFVYAFVPNTHVRLKSAAVGGLVAGTMWQSAQWLYIHWQIGFTKYNAIYGSFAQLPLFLVWLYISWIIVLLGAEVSFAVQHMNAFVRRGLSQRLSPLSRQKVAVAALSRIAARFAAGLSPLPVRLLARDLRLPEDVVADTLGILADAGMVAPMGEAEDLGYGLAVAADNIRMAEVLAVLERCGDGGECGGMLIHEGVDPLFDAFAETLGSSPANVTLEEFARSEAEELRSSGARARELEAIRSRAGQQC